VHRPGGLTALADQQIAGGIIWVLGSAAYTVTLLVGLYRWMEADSKVAQRGSAVTP
jgi:cytochrome c oxidase assembly factor CtaG